MTLSEDHQELPQRPWWVPGVSRAGRAVGGGEWGQAKAGKARWGVRDGQTEPVRATEGLPFVLKAMHGFFWTLVDATGVEGKLGIPPGSTPGLSLE